MAQQGESSCLTGLQIFGLHTLVLAPSTVHLCWAQGQHTAAVWALLGPRPAAPSTALHPAGSQSSASRACCWCCRLTLLLMDLPGSSSMTVALPPATAASTACNSKTPAVTSGSNSVLDVMNGLYVSSSMVLQRVDSLVLTLPAAEQVLHNTRPLLCTSTCSRRAGLGLLTLLLLLGQADRAQLMFCWA